MVIIPMKLTGKSNGVKDQNIVIDFKTSENSAVANQLAERSYAKNF